MPYCRSTHFHRTHRKSRHFTPSIGNGWDGDRLVSTETASSKTHTVYEPGSFVPLLRISQAMDQNSPKTEAEATEANARGLLALASQHGKPAKPVNPGDKAKAPIQLPGFGTAQWAALSSSFAQVAQKGYPEHMKTILRQGGLDPDKLTEMAKAAVAQQQAEDTAKLTIQMYHCNHLGTPIALINQSGLIDWAVELDPWGNVLNEFNPNEIDQPIRMQGQQIDRESGLFYNRHRYYDPQMGRYITQDPIGLEGGNNLYGYVGNPNQWIDPLGLDPTAPPSRGPDLGKQKGWFDKAKDLFDWKENVEKGREIKIKQDALMCQAEKDMEKRVNEEQITPEAAKQALAFKKFSIYADGPISAGVEATQDGVIANAAKTYGYATAPAKSCP
jgi:RHS repeat-associated protein